jgi:hypothetical protein
VNEYHTVEVQMFDQFTLSNDGSVRSWPGRANANGPAAISTVASGASEQNNTAAWQLLVGLSAEQIKSEFLRSVRA